MNIIFPRSKPGSSCPGCLLPGGEPGCNGCHPAGCDCKEEKLRRKLALVKFQPEAWNGGVLPRADRAQAQAHAVAPIGVDGDQEAATIFFATWGSGLCAQYGQHGQHGGTVWVHNKAYGQLAGWSMVIGKSGREEREGLLHQCCCIVSLLTDPPSKSKLQINIGSFFLPAADQASHIIASLSRIWSPCRLIQMYTNLRSHSSCQVEIL